MLKEKLETGAVDTQLEYTDSEEIAGCHFVGLERTCSIDDISTMMEKDMKKLMSLPIEAKSIPGNAAYPFTMISKWKMGKGLVSYTCAIPVMNTSPCIAALADVTVSGYRPPCDAFTVTHTGNYDHLGNAWAAGMMRAQNKIFPQNKKLSPFELYMTSPESDETPVTKICIPRK